MIFWRGCILSKSKINGIRKVKQTYNSFINPPDYH
jgi:hypothetical protein